MSKAIINISAGSAASPSPKLAASKKFLYLVGMQSGLRTKTPLCGLAGLVLLTAQSAFAQTPPETPPPSAAAAPETPVAEAPPPAPQTPQPYAGATAPGQPTSSPPPQPPLIQLQKDPPLPPPVMRTDHVHDGFYARLSLGFGQLGATMNAPESGAIKGDGSTLTLDVSLGYAVSPGIVLGAMLIAEQMPSVELSANAPVVTDVSAGMLGAFFDGYPNPRGGFHLGGGLGFAGTGIQRKAAAGFDRAGGFGLTGWVGYDIWVADQWSAGLLVRLMGTRTRADAEETENNLSGNATMATRSISLLLTGVYN